MTNGEYSLLGEYTGTTKIALFRHNVCGTIYHSRVTLVTARTGNCPACSANKKRLHNPRTKTTSQYINEVYDIVGNEYYVSGTIS